MTYGLGIIGVSDSMLRDMRRVAAAIAAPASGTGGQNLDAAFTVADGGPPVERTQRSMLTSSQLGNGQWPCGANGFPLNHYTGWWQMVNDSWQEQEMSGQSAEDRQRHSLQRAIG